MFVGWVEEIPGALTHGRTLDECRRKLRDALQLMIETHRDEARMALDSSCIEEWIEIDLPDTEPVCDPPKLPEDFAEYGIVQGHA